MGKPGHFSELRIYVAVPAVDADLSKKHTSEDEPGRESAEETELSTESMVLKSGYVRNPDAYRDKSEYTGHADREEGYAPCGKITDEGAERHADEGGDGHPGNHECHGAYLLAGSGEASGHYCTYAEIGAVGEPGDESGDDEWPVPLGHASSEVADGDDCGEGEHDGAKRDAAGEEESRGAYAYTGGIGRDEIACLRDGDVHALGNVAENPHHQEFGDAESESAHSEGSESFVH